MANFSQINFKYTDAEEERLYAPQLLEEAYVDINGILDAITSPEKFLVVGPKGAGKTALASKLLLMDKHRWDLFVDGDILEQFEYHLLNKTGGEKGTTIGGSLTAWQLILFLRIIPLFLKDERFKDNNSGIIKLSESLKKYGLSESDSLISIIQYTSRRGIFGKVKSAISEVTGEKIEEENYKVKDPAALLSSIKSIFEKTIPSESNFYLVIDGLDYILREGRDNTKYIADLINAVRQLNIFFASLGLSAKAIILIRNEVLKVVPDPNLTKRINDNGVQLKWFDNVRSPFDSSLLEVIRSRAALAGYHGSMRELWYNWFPKEINGTGSFEFVIVNTRYLPRDLISFFREVQKLGKQPPFNRVDVLSALNNYSDWFLQELGDALVGVIDENIRVELPDIISELGRSFKIDDLKEKLDEHELLSRGITTEQIARDLFNSSWLGNRWDTNKGTPRYSWKHRKINANLNLKHELVVHSGLWKSLNLI